jgi:phosphatidylserine/phosphatidylglycerophosphate/cardiolipin synthase-like enzyme
MLLPSDGFASDRASHTGAGGPDVLRTRAILARTFVLTIVALASTITAPAIIPSARAAQIEACFSPRLPGDCDPTATIVRTIDGARRSILVQAYEITSRPIVNALVRAHRRGVGVRAIVDYGQLHDRRYHNEANEVRLLRAAGIRVLVDRPRNGLMHDKVMIIDGDTVITGSFNYTYRAEHSNVENLLVIHDPALAAQYARHWRSRAAMATESIVSSDARGTASWNGAVVGNRRTRIYQWPGCPYYGRVSFRDRVEFPTAQAAAEAGYRPARNCR